MEKFCGNCGSKLEEKTGLCPKCNKKDNKKELRRQKKTEKKNLKKQKKKAKWAAKTTGQKAASIILKILVWLFIGIVLNLGITSIFVYKGVVEVPIINEIFEIFGIEEEYEVPMIDVEKYYGKNSKIIERTNVKDSEQIYSEAEAFELLTDRGFADYEITTEYSMEGEYYESVNVSKDSKEKHPIYGVYYFSESGMIWSIAVINDSITASPVTYNVESENSVPVIVSESDYVTGYDSVTNMFYEVEPKETFVKVITVEKIDSETLEKLTYEKIEDLRR